MNSFSRGITNFSQQYVPQFKFLYCFYNLKYFVTSPYPQNVINNMHVMSCMSQYFYSSYTRPFVYIFSSPKVNHSQRRNETPLKPWIATTDGGTIITAHCDCIAGFGETCSHVGALLFAVEAGVSINKAKTCTSLPCKWLMPTPVTSVPYQELRNMYFTSSKTKKKKLDTKMNLVRINGPFAL